MEHLFDFEFDPDSGFAFPAWAPGFPWMHLVYPLDMLTEPEAMGD